VAALQKKKEEESPKEVEDRVLTEREEMAAWRTIGLIDAGFTYLQAIQIGPDRPDIVHTATALLATGKTHEQVAWLLELTEY
jgi:hypothetical protein